MSEHDEVAESARTTKVLGWVSFFQDLGSKMVAPILPLFLTQVLGAPPVAVGLSDGVGDATALVSTSIGGRLADRGRPVLLVRFGYGLSSISKLLLAFVMSWPAVIGLRVTDRIGKGVRDAPRDVLLARRTKGAGAAFGFQQAMDKAGGALGPLVGLAAFELAGERFRPVFVVAFVPCAISVGLLWLVRSDLGAAARRGVEAVRPAGRLTGPFWWQVAPFALVGIARLGDGLLVLRVSDMGASTTAVLLSFAAMRAANAIAAYPAGRLADRVRPGVLVATGGVILAGAQAALALGTTGAALWVIVPIVGLVDPLLRTPTKLAILGAADDEQRGKALGDVQAVIGIVSLGVSIAAGLAWSGSGQLPFAVASVATFAAAVWTGARTSRRP